MNPHTLDAAAIEAAVEEVCRREFMLASAVARNGGRKRLFYDASREIFIIRSTNEKDLECQQADMAATFYSER